MISEESIQKVRQVNIVDVIGNLVSLKQKGANFSACCPFHNEKTPSFSVSAAKQIYKCYGCGEGGDALKFVMRHERLDFLDAVEFIARISKITLEYDRSFDREAIQRQREEQKNLRDLLNDAHQLYCKYLWDDSGADALSYLQNERNYTPETITSWGLGFAPNDGRILCDIYREKGLLPKGEQVGLVRAKEESRYYDVYRNRIVFPVLDERGELVTFAGRTMRKDDKYPKYINGYQSPIYNKSAVLYGLYQAIPHIKAAKYAILVEGNPDVVSMHVAGAANTVAPCGTELTDDQIKLLKRYTDSVILMPDMDVAKDGKRPGIEAAKKNLRKLISFGIKAEIFLLPEVDGKKQDPDDFAKQFFTQPEPEHEEA